MIIRLNAHWEGPERRHYPGETFDTEAGDLTEAQAAALIAGRAAKPVEDFMVEGPKGSWTVPLAAGSKRIKGKGKALAALIEDGAR